MNALKLLLVVALIIVGLVNRRHSKKPQEAPAPARASAVQPAVNQEILQNAERLAETLRQCKQTQHKETK